MRGASAPPGALTFAPPARDAERLPLKSLDMFLRAARHAASRPRSALLLARMAWWVLVLTVLMRTTSLTRALKFVSRESRGRAPRADAEAVQVRLARSLDMLLATEFWVFTPTCWKRAPVLQRFLALEGIDTRVVFGVKAPVGSTLSGHAWLERGGVPVLEASHPDYVPTFSHPA